MKNSLRSGTAVLLVSLAASAIYPLRTSAAETINDDLDLVRSAYIADREAFVAENIQLTEAEGNAFWPLYNKYRAAREALGDELVKVVLEYADAYPDVPDDRARKLLKDYSRLEKKLTDQKGAYLKKFGKILPPAKALRFAQLDNRLDLVLRLQLASKIPLVPIEGRLFGTAAGAVTFTEGTAGGAVVGVYQLNAEVTAIDKAARKVTLLSPAGIKQTVKVGPDVINFDQIRVGDQIKVTAAEELIVQVGQAGDPVGVGNAALVALAPKGAKPGGILAETTRVTAKVKKIDLENRTATLQFADGTTKTLRVRADVDLNRCKVGESVVFRVTEMIALSVETP